MMKRLPGKLATILLIGLFFRLVIFTIEQPWRKSVVENILFDSDSAGYHHLAVTLLTLHHFSQAADGPPEALRTPVYPFFIAFLYLVFGVNPWTVILGQIVLDLFSCCLLFLITKKLYEKAAMIAAFFYAIDPFLILYSNQYMSEPLFIFLLLLGSWLLLSFMIHPDKSRFLIFSAIVFALAALTRPIALYLPVLIVPLFFIVMNRHRRKAARAGAVFAGIFFCVLLPWLMRNYHHFGNFSISTSRSLNMLVLQVAPITMEQQHVPLNDAQVLLLKEAEASMIRDGKNPLQLSDFQKADYWEKLAMRMIQEKPFIFLKYYFYGIVQNFWGLGTTLCAQVLKFAENGTSFDPRTCSNLIEIITQWIVRKTLLQKYLGFLVAIFLLFTYLLALTGVKEVWKKPNRNSYAFAIGLILYFVLLTGSAVSVRFKLPVIPFYYIFTAVGFSGCLQYFKTRHRFG